MHTFLNWRNILFWIPFGSDLDLNRVCKCREREREREIKVNIPSADRQVERERERCVCSFWISLDFFYSGNSSTYFKVCVDHRTRCLAASILEYNINWKGRTKQCSDSSVVRGEWTYSTGIAMLLSNLFCRDATRSAKKINPHANPALNPRNSRAKPSLFPPWNLAHVRARVATCRYDVASLSHWSRSRTITCV